MTPEGKVKQQVKGLLKRYGAYYHMPVQNGMGDPALDFHVCHRGRYAAVETKAPGGKPTPRQKTIMRRAFSAGASVFLIDGNNLHALENWLNFQSSMNVVIGVDLDVEHVPAEAEDFAG